jgi:hypothetical protein
MEWLIQFPVRLQGRLESFLSRSKGFAQPTLQNFSGRQFCQIFRNSNAAPFKLQQLDMLVRLAGTEDHQG